MAVYRLPDEPLFPPVDEAEPDGLIAIGGDLTVDRLIQAYAQGIFPWFVDEDEIFWYSPDPRMVLYPADYRVSDSLRRIIRKGTFTVQVDTDFNGIIKACSEANRPGQDGTWITQEFILGYTELHRKGLAHSIGTYYNGKLVGGLYGISLGAAFFGESMFFTMSNASKVAFHHLVELALAKKFIFIDCQAETSHLTSLGARLIPRNHYLLLLAGALEKPTRRGSWDEK